MAYYALVVCCTAAFCLAIVRFLGPSFSKMARAAISQLDTIIDTTLAEQEKEKRLLQKLGRLWVALFSVLALFIGILIICFLPLGLYAQWKSANSLDFSSWKFYLSMTLGSLVLFLPLSPKKGDYGYWSKLLHQLVLDHYHIGKYLLKREQKKAAIPPVTSPPAFLVVTGLARGGTTALTRLLFDDAHFHSINYAHMPFLMAPQSWRKITPSRSQTAKERAHGDQIMVKMDSIEALEEYFFKLHLNDAYILEDRLVLHTVPEEVQQAYWRYQCLFQQAEKSTLYLAKNNNFILRYTDARQHNPYFHLVMIFRNPEDHALSLFKQHKNFTQQQTDDPFTLEYMDWLGHHEFGLHHKPFDLGQEKWRSQYPTDTPNYWLALWVEYYQYVLSLPPDSKRYLIDYQDLLLYPDALRQTLGGALGVPLARKNEPPFQQKNRTTSSAPKWDAALLTHAQTIHHQLRGRKMEIADIHT